MSVNTVFFPRLTRTRLSQRILALGATSALTLSLSGCGTGLTSVFTPTVTPLPPLSAEQELRDHLARTEAAVAARAKEFAAKASGCADCAEVASSIATSAEKRLADMGGLWQPWPEDLPQSALVERPYPVADAPLMPAEFTQWLHVTGVYDLQAVAKGKASVESRPALVLSALARMRDAHRLAALYNVTLADSTIPTPGSDLTVHHDALNGAYERVGTLTTLDPDQTKKLRQWASWHWADDDLTLSEEELTLNEAAVTADADNVASAIQHWDCAAQQLPGIGVETDAVDFANENANELLTRSGQLLALGAKDQRVLRCTEEAPSFEKAAQHVIRADLHLVVSSTPSVSWHGIVLLQHDMEHWNAYVSDADLAAMLEPVDTPQSQ